MPLQPPTAGRRAPSRRRRLLAGGALAAAVTFGCLGAPAAAAPAPSEIGGDRHSPGVAMLAAQALVTRDVYAMTRTFGAFTEYVHDRNATAAAVALEFGAPAAEVRAAWARAGFDHQTAVLAALSQLGVEYQYATSTPGVGFDCSGLTAHAWARAGVALTRQSSAQIAESVAVDPAVAKAGDLVQYPGHVMLYLGFGGAIVHAANHASDVELDTLSEGRSYNWANPS